MVGGDSMMVGGIGPWSGDSDMVSGDSAKVGEQRGINRQDEFI